MADQNGAVNQQPIVPGVFEVRPHIAANTMANHWTAIVLNTAHQLVWSPETAIREAATARRYIAANFPDYERKSVWMTGNENFTFVIYKGQNPDDPCAFPLGTMKILLHKIPEIVFPEDIRPTLNYTALTQYAAPELYHFPDRITLPVIHSYIVARAGMPLPTVTSAGVNTLAFLSGAFCVFSDFRVYMDSYYECVDDHLSLSGEITRFPNPSPESNPMTNTELYAIAFMGFLCMNKVIVNQNQYSEVFKKRVEAIAYTLNCPSLPVTKVNSVITRTVATSLNKYAGFYPKLRRVMALTILNSPSPIKAHARMILKETQMSAFCLIQSFIAGKPKTSAHIEPEVMVDVKKYLPVMATLSSHYGEDWVYHKLYNPESDDTSNSQWPNLISAAIAWNAAHKDETILRMMTQTRQFENYIRLSCMILDDALVVDRQHTYLSERERQYLYQCMGIHYIVPGANLREYIKENEDREVALRAKHTEYKALQQPDNRQDLL